MDLDKAIREVLDKRIDDGLIEKVVESVKREIAEEIGYIIAVLEDEKTDEYFGPGTSKRFALDELDTILLNFKGDKTIK